MLRTSTKDRWVETIWRPVAARTAALALGGGLALALGAAPAVAGSWDTFLQDMSKKVIDSATEAITGEGEQDAAPPAEPGAPSHVSPGQGTRGVVQTPPPSYETDDTPRYNGPWVSEIQSRLTSLGYNPGPVDGAFGGKTRTAITQFQRGQGLRATGEPTPSVMAALRAAAPAPGYPTAAAPPVAHAQGSRQANVAPQPMPPAHQSAQPPQPPADDTPRYKHAWISEMQNRLAQQGYSPGPATGTFGKATAGAIAAFQRDQGLAVTGLPAPSVMDRLRAGSSSASTAPVPGHGLVQRRASPLVPKGEMLGELTIIRLTGCAYTHLTGYNGHARGVTACAADPSHVPSRLYQFISDQGGYAWVYRPASSPGCMTWVEQRDDGSGRLTFGKGPPRSAKGQTLCGEFALKRIGENSVEFSGGAVREILQVEQVVPIVAVDWNHPSMSIYDVRGIGLGPADLSRYPQYDERSKFHVIYNSRISRKEVRVQGSESEGPAHILFDKEQADAGGPTTVLAVKFFEKFKTPPLRGVFEQALFEKFGKPSTVIKGGWESSPVTYLWYHDRSGKKLENLGEKTIRSCFDSSTNRENRDPFDNSTTFGLWNCGLVFKVKTASQDLVGENAVINYEMLLFHGQAVAQRHLAHGLEEAASMKSEKIAIENKLRVKPTF